MCAASEYEWRIKWPITLRVDFIVILPIVWLKRVRGAVMTTDSETNAHTHTPTQRHTHTRTCKHKRAVKIIELAEPQRRGIATFTHREKIEGKRKLGKNLGSKVRPTRLHKSTSTHPHIHTNMENHTPINIMQRTHTNKEKYTPIHIIKPYSCTGAK